MPGFRGFSCAPHLSTIQTCLFTVKSPARIFFQRGKSDHAAYFYSVSSLTERKSLVYKISWLGRLPGDIRIERENFRFYFPVVTCLLLSLVLTLILWAVHRIRG